MIIPGVGYETSSGGPFFRGGYCSIFCPGAIFEPRIDINNQGSAQQELYFYMNSNHEQTETYRTGFFGPWVPLKSKINAGVHGTLLVMRWPSRLVLRHPEIWIQALWIVLVSKAMFLPLVVVPSPEAIRVLYPDSLLRLDSR